MTTDDFAHFSARLVELGELYEAPLTESKLLLYFQALDDLPLGVVLDGIRQAARTCRFFPRPVEVRTLAVGDDEDAAEQAWLTYRHLARAVGGYGSPTVPDGALAATLEAVFGSWEAACWTDLTPEMWAAKRKEFGRVYRVLRQRGDPGPRQLTGFITRENALRGYAPTDGPHALPDGRSA